jgi:hypothetical protein
MRRSPSRSARASEAVHPGFSHPVVPMRSYDAFKVPITPWKRLTCLPGDQPSSSASAMGCATVEREKSGFLVIRPGDFGR